MVKPTTKGMLAPASSFQRKEDWGCGAGNKEMTLLEVKG
jgi:hypothetical protein